LDGAGVRRRPRQFRRGAVHAHLVGEVGALHGPTGDGGSRDNYGHAGAESKTGAPAARSASGRRRARATGDERKRPV
jgi:hypothetical protein